ncbi:carbohydrate ABC transporter membrane protein 1, CUT1 family [Ruania alba]|uniref:Carbohydrate ABC transporter membrane protein 1, CUT1 family n=2 Tax=Ruania alba TaxID=648782 RepID=A0A1H5MW13_9MICO|nr:carbohydrate ABC transporter membrane protein 1, CUT1 family [Ruania alba]
MGTTPPPTRPRRSRRRRDARTALAFLAPSGLGFAMFTLGPIVASVVIAFFAWPVIGERSFTGLTNFVTIFTTDPIFWQSVGNTLIFVAWYVPLNFVLALGLAVWISPRIRGRGFYRLMFFLPTVTPIVANALVWRLLLQPDGIGHEIAALFGVAQFNPLGSESSAMAVVVAMSVWQGFGYNMLVFSAGLDAIPEQLYEAAALDGATAVHRFIRITVPMLSPSIFFATVMTLITAFQVFAQPYVLTGGGPGVATTTVVMYLYQRGFELFDLGTASAVATVLFLLIAMITAVQFVGQRKWVHYE